MFINVLFYLIFDFGGEVVGDDVTSMKALIVALAGN